MSGCHLIPVIYDPAFLTRDGGELAGQFVRRPGIEGGQPGSEDAAGQHKLVGPVRSSMVQVLEPPLVEDTDLSHHRKAADGPAVDVARDVGDPSFPT
jgi:hypothetical protein